MSHALKKYSSLFLLGIFLFAYTEKGIHDILHADDEHCHSLTEKHFHNQEHHCFICDFNISLSDNHTFLSQNSFLQYANGIFFVISEQNLVLRNSTSLSARGPPQVI